MIFIALLLFSCVAVTFCEETVKYVAIIYRHGDRTPVDTYPTDPWKNESLWPVRFGELTNIGKKQHYALGQWLRKRYSHILSDQFDPVEVYVRSTDVDRTLMSAQANLAGMFPPSGTSIWNPALLWQPIPVHTVPEKDDELLAMKKHCPAYNMELKRVKLSKEYKEKLSKYQTLMDYLSAYTGKKVKDYYDIDDIYNILYIESLYNFSLPNWTHSVYPNKLREPAGYSFSVLTMTPLLARLKVGPILKEIVTRMVHLITNHKNIKLQKVAIYSGHDITIASILNALGIFDFNCPPYSATILMELIEDDITNMHYVQISYRNSTEIVEPHILPIPYCGERCPIERFIKLYENLITVNWNYECGNQFSSLIGVSFCIGLMLFLSIYMLHKIHFSRVLRQSGYQNMTYTSIHNPIVTKLQAEEA